MISVTKCFEFEAAHSLPGYNGPCANLHGHTYKLEVEVTSNLAPKDMVVDFKVLKENVEEKVISVLDHHLINDVIENPTAENTVGWIVNALRAFFNLYYLELIRVRLWETSNSYCEWKK